jgi:hypothetical protein
MPHMRDVFGGRGEREDLLYALVDHFDLQDWEDEQGRFVVASGPDEDDAFLWYDPEKDAILFEDRDHSASQPQVVTPRTVEGWIDAGRIPGQHNVQAAPN